MHHSHYCSLMRGSHTGFISMQWRRGTWTMELQHMHGNTNMRLTGTRPKSDARSNISGRGRYWRLSTFSRRPTLPTWTVGYNWTLCGSPSLRNNSGNGASCLCFISCTISRLTIGRLSYCLNVSPTPMFSYSGTCVCVHILNIWIFHHTLSLIIRTHIIYSVVFLPCISTADEGLRVETFCLSLFFIVLQESWLTFTLSAHSNEPLH